MNILDPEPHMMIDDIPTSAFAVNARLKAHVARTTLATTGQFA